MKPRTKIQSRIMELSGHLRPLTPAQRRWAYRSTIDHYAYRLKSGRCTCMDCGHEWMGLGNGIIRCPHCGATLEIKDTKERVCKAKSYFNIITTSAEFQIIRMFMMLVEMRKGMKSNPAFLEVGQYWIDPKRKVTVVGLQRSMGGYYLDSFLFCSYLEVRRDNEAFQRIAHEYVYPHIKVTDTIRRNGFRNSTHGIHPVALLTQLLTNPHAETLMKQGDIKMLSYLTRNPKEVDKYWNSVKIAKRNDYIITDPQLWFDYLRMLDRLGKDLNSPKLIMPSDLKTTHDEYVVKLNRQRQREQREADRRKAQADQAKFEELKSRYFGLMITDGNITLHTPETIDEYFDLGERMALCVASARYFVKETSLVLTATIAEKPVAVIEISLTDYTILQCRAFANGVSEYSAEIAALIAANTALIADRKAA